MDETYVLKLVEAALDPNRTDPSGVEAVELIQTRKTLWLTPADGPSLRVLINDGPRWIELKLGILEVQDVTADIGLDQP